MTAETARTGTAGLHAVESAPEQAPRKARPRPNRSRKPVAAERPPEGRLAYSVKEAAWAMGCHPNTIWNLLSGGDLEGFTLNRKRMIAIAELEHFMALGGTGRKDGSARLLEAHPVHPGRLE